MTTDPHKRLDLDAWLQDLRRLGGQARTLSERHESLKSLMDLADLRMLEEATKRIIVTLSRKALYGLPQARVPEGASRAGSPRPVGSLEPILTLPNSGTTIADYGLASHEEEGGSRGPIVATILGQDGSDGIIGSTDSSEPGLATRIVMTV